MKLTRNNKIALLCGLTFVLIGLWNLFYSAGNGDFSNRQSPTGSRVIDTAKQVKEKLTGKATQGAFEKALENEILSLNQPMDFYGKVVDHTGRGVADATIVYTWSVQQGAMWSPEKSSGGQIQSRPDGTFEIRVKSARWITIHKINSAGYIRPWIGGNRVERSFSRETGEADFYQPDPKNPRLFYLVPESAIVPLYSNSDEFGVGGITRVKLAPSGVPTKIDIRTGKTDPNGELEITLNLGKRIESPVPHTPWTAKIGTAGGVVEVFRESKYAEMPPFAPVEGYQSQIDYSKPMITGYQREIFFRTRDGLYGFLRCQINANSEGGSARINLFLNPNPGNRLLHFDRRMRIK
jgi:hypothetical protein